MKRKPGFLLHGMGVFAASAVLCFGVLHAAQNGAGTKTQSQRCAGCSADGKTTPRTADGHPDFSGFYNNADVYHGDPKEEKPHEHVVNRLQNGSVFLDYGGANLNEAFPADAPPNPNQPPYKAEYLAKVKEIAATRYGGTTPLDPIMDCKPEGIPRAGLGIMQILQNATGMAIMYEASPGPYFRMIYMDGRPHPKDVDASYMGHSIGHWDGDTLVVDVVGLNDETWLGGGTGSDANNMTSIHSDQEHVIERWSRSGDTISYQATVEDPVMLTKPWVLTARRASLAPADDYIEPQMCVPNDKTHLIKPSETDKFECDFCVKDTKSVFGPDAGPSNKK
jgi:hypothetical protein